MKVTRTTQLHIRTEDTPGNLAKVMEAISTAGVNVLAYVGYSQPPTGGHILLVTEDNAKAAKAIEAAGYAVRVQQAVLVRDTDKVGVCAGHARKIANAGINVTGAYATTCGAEYLSVFQAADLDALIKAIS